MRCVIILYHSAVAGIDGYTLLKTIVFALTRGISIGIYITERFMSDTRASGGKLKEID